MPLDRLLSPLNSSVFNVEDKIVCKEKKNSTAWQMGGTE